MKNVAISTTIFLLSSVLFICQTAQAQWVNGTSIYPTTLTKKVGIGMSTPGYILHVNGTTGINGPSLSFLSGGGLVIKNTDDNSFLTLDGNKLQARKTVSTGGVLTAQANALLLNPYQGVVGVGTSAATEARFVVKGDVTQTIAMFGQGTAGISLVRDWSTVAFNAYYSGSAWKAMSPGYGALLGCDPGTGRIQIFQNTYASSTNAVVSATTVLAIAPNGNILIGTGNDYGFKLAVNGSIRAKEIRVQTNWADYVFADDYQLRPLAEVEAFIRENKHLPEIQSAAEIQENGLDVAATTTKMMAKIEELTLYLIELKKENDALQTRIQQLEKGKN